MNDDHNVQAELKKRLEQIDGDSIIPEQTLQKAKRRRRFSTAAAALGGVASLVVVALAFQLVDSGSPSTDIAPIATPSESSASPEPEESLKEERENGIGGIESPPPVTITTVDQSFELDAWSYCYSNGCVDGAPSENLPDVGSPDEVIVEFPLEGWSFMASFQPSGERCGRYQDVRLQSSGDGRFVLHPVGHADSYDVTLYGRGEGSLAVSFRWTTPSDGPLAEPEARAAILAGGPHDLQSYGVELELKNLAETPEEASATITVEASDGGSVTFEAERAHGRCWPEGTVYWDGPDDKGTEATQLGEAPFHYTVDVMLDGRRYVGTGTWPKDEIRGNAPSVSLDFSPPLPALR